MNQHTPFSPHRNFADNLRALCTRHGSIAAVCRALGMNRQQFNKYLSGSTLPNAATLEKICNFFRIESESLFHDPARFQKPKEDLLLSGFPLHGLGLAANAFAGMQPTTLRTGCYHLYSLWPRDEAKCLREAVFIQKKGDVTVFTRFTKYRAVGQRQHYYLSGRHDGVVLEAEKARFLLSLNRKGCGEVSLVSMGSENALSQGFLSGLALTMAPSGTPQAVRATLQFRGCSDALRRAIRDAGVLPLDDQSIPEEVRQSLTLPRQAPVAHLEAFSLLDGLPSAFP
ncbi:MAG: helix-turn-helix transcriptional regulator [Aestuariivirga sp.]|uniref:helix-turn-helix domain-containing protein n=1 Tax=Aestuariivirga sp. TaxID=2650926 RepID=UPI00301AE2A1